MIPDSMVPAVLDMTGPVSHHSSPFSGLSEPQGALDHIGQGEPSWRTKCECVCVCVRVP